MNFFGLETQADKKPATKKTTLVTKTGTTQFLGFGGGKAKDDKIKPEKLTKEYDKCIDEIFKVINAKRTDETNKIKVSTVTVKLGVDAGGSVGFFVEGRVDVSLAFEVEFKVSD